MSVEGCWCTHIPDDLRYENLPSRAGLRPDTFLGMEQHHEGSPVRKPQAKATTMKRKTTIYPKTPVTPSLTPKCWVNVLSHILHVDLAPHLDSIDIDYSRLDTAICDWRPLWVMCVECRFGAQRLQYADAAKSVSRHFGRPAHKSNMQQHVAHCLRRLHGPWRMQVIRSAIIGYWNIQPEWRRQECYCFSQATPPPPPPVLGDNDLIECPYCAAMNLRKDPSCRTCGRKKWNLYHQASVPDKEIDYPRHRYLNLPLVHP